MAETLSYYSHRRIDETPGLPWRIWRLVWVLAVCVVVAAVATPMLLLGAALLLAGAYALRLTRRGRGQRIVAYCQQATSANLPLGPMLEVAAWNESPTMKRRLLRIVEHLDAGLSLGTALDRAAPELGRDVVGAIAAAERLGRLPHTLTRMWNEMLRRGRVSERTRTVVQACAVYMLVAMWVLVFVVYVTFPRFKYIFADFHAQAPESVRLILSIWHTAPFSLFQSVLDNVDGDWFLFIMLGSVVLLWALFIWPVALGMFFRPTRWLFEGSAWDAIAWRVPVLGGLVRDRGLARVLDFVADAVANGYGLDRALMEAGPAAGNRVLAGRIETWAEGIAAGKSIEQAARAAGMPRQVVGFLAPVRSSDDLSAALRFLSAHYDYRAERTSAIAQALLIPAFVVIVGSFVTLLGLSVFQSLALIVQSVGPYQFTGGL